MATLDPALLGVAILDTVLWTLVGAILATLVLLLVDKLTPKWFDLREIGNNPTAIAVFAAGVMIGISVLIAGVIMSP